MNQPLSQQLFVLLSSLVEERAGLHYPPTELPLFSDKIWSRIGDAGFESPLDYYYFLRYDPAGGAELGSLVDALVVNETYLFRELDALSAAVNHVIVPAIEERGRARVWSAGCSTGEEPFTLAMMIADGGKLDRVSLMATDVSNKALSKARAGVLPQRSLRATAPNAARKAPAWVARVVERWITPMEGGGGEMSREIVDAVDFRRDSLIEPKAIDLVELDLILCRNVLIYFRDDVVRRVVEMLAQRLRPGGRLLVGTSESLLRFGTLLRCEERAGTFFYTKDAA